MTGKNKSTPSTTSEPPNFIYELVPVSFKRWVHDTVAVDFVEPGTAVFVRDGVRTRTAKFLYVLTSLGFQNAFPSIVLARDVAELVGRQGLSLTYEQQRFIDCAAVQIWKARQPQANYDCDLPFIEGYTIVRRADKLSHNFVDVLSSAYMPNSNYALRVRESNVFNKNREAFLKLPKIPEPVEEPRPPILQEYGENPNPQQRPKHVVGDDVQSQQPALSREDVYEAVRDGLHAAVLMLVEEGLSKYLPAMLSADPSVEESDRADIYEDMQRLHAAFKAASAGDKE